MKKTLVKHVRLTRFLYISYVTKGNKIMKKVARLEIKKYQRKYNDVVLYNLRKANINYKEESSGPFAINIMIPEEQFDQAYKIVMQVSYKNPKYVD